MEKIVCTREEVRAEVQAAIKLHNIFVREELDGIKKIMQTGQQNPSVKTMELIESLKVANSDLRNIFKDHLTDQRAHEKAVMDKLDCVMPVANDIKNIENFFTVGKKIGIGTAIAITTIGVIFGAILAIKDWIKKD